MPVHKMCLACNQEFVGDVQNCPKDGTALILLQDNSMIGVVFDDRYKILDVVRKTATGATYEVEDVRAGGTKNWLTELAWTPATPEDWKHVTKRIEQLTELKSPHVVPITNFGIVDRNRIYWISPHFDLLEYRLPSLPDFEVGMAILRGVARGLADCHAQGLIHSNLSPDSVLVMSSEENPNAVKLTDLMIGRAKMWSGSGYTCVDFNEIFGSSGYMSPEQLMGKSVGPSSDMYVFGCLMYRVLTGRPPFEGAHALATAHLQVTEKAPTFATVNNKVKVPADIEMVARRCLEKEPKDRFGSMEDVVRALGC